MKISQEHADAINQALCSVASLDPNGWDEKADTQTQDAAKFCAYASFFAATHDRIALMPKEIEALREQHAQEYKQSAKRPNVDAFRDGWDMAAKQIGADLFFSAIARHSVKPIVSEYDEQIGQEAFRAIGGRRAMSMIGGNVLSLAAPILGIQSGGVYFAYKPMKRIGGRLSANRCLLTVTPADMYRVQLEQFSLDKAINGQPTKAIKVWHVYLENLRASFEDATGLALSL